MRNLHADFAWVCDRYQALFGHFGPRYDHILLELVAPIVNAIGQSDAPYHTLDHTLQVVRVGHAILEGKQYYDGAVSPQDWLHFMVSLFCQDIGYVKGIFERDAVSSHRYFDGQKGHIKLAPTATGAALYDYHVDRSKAYVAIYVRHPKLDVRAVQKNIEMTRFPIPHSAEHQEKLNYGGLCRAADLLGQLSAPDYLCKLPALFQEFEEVGMNQFFGHTTSEDLKTEYPYFFWQVVYPYVKDSMRYLSATVAGRQAIARLYTNLCLVELNQPLCDVTNDDLREIQDESDLLHWQEAGFTFT